MKKIGKVILIVFIVLVVLGALSSACSKKPSDSDASTNVKPSSSQSATSEEPSASTATNAGEAFVGTWDMTEMDTKDLKLSKSDLQSARNRGLDSYLVLREDGTSLLVIGDQQADFLWEAYDATSGMFGTEKEGLAMERSGDSLVIKGGDEHMSFSKGTPRQEAPSAEEKPSSAGNDTSAGGVSPDLKEMLDSYEAFMDEYIEFMKEYQNSDDVMGMLQGYTDYMQKYSDFVEKVDQIDTSKMSAADYAYYLEVTTRVSKKLLEASVL